MPCPLISDIALRERVLSSKSEVCDGSMGMEGRVFSSQSGLHILTKKDFLCFSVFQTMRHRHALLVPIVFFTLISLGVAEVSPLPQVLSPNDAHLRYSGRWDTGDVAGPRAMWSACSVSLRFSGSALNVTLGGQADNAFQVVIDGKPASVITLKDGQALYPVASHLPKGEHTIELCKRTEAFIGLVQVKGFQLEADSRLLDLPKLERRVEFIGDSITAGYGNEAASAEERFKPQTENAWLAYGAVAARLLKAELMCEAQSGICLVANGTEESMPRRWDRTFFYEAGSLWDFTRWQPDAVVVNLGTNDAFRQIDAGTWNDTYRAFIARIRAVYPKAHLFLTIGSMGHGPNGVIPELNAALVESYKKAGDARVHGVILALQDPANGYGADWHPSAKTHQLMGEAMAAAISKELGW